MEADDIYVIYDTTTGSIRACSIGIEIELFDPDPTDETQLINVLNNPNYKSVMKKVADLDPVFNDQKIDRFRGVSEFVVDAATLREELKVEPVTAQLRARAVKTTLKALDQEVDVVRVRDVAALVSYKGGKESG